jgi:hypothetical protein
LAFSAAQNANAADWESPDPECQGLLILNPEITPYDNGSGFTANYSVRNTSKVSRSFRLTFASSLTKMQSIGSGATSSVTIAIAPQASAMRWTKQRTWERVASPRFQDCSPPPSTGPASKPTTVPWN